MPRQTEQRRAQIVAWLEGHDLAEVEELSRQFGVSLVTIRKDLTALEQRGLWRRTHGGALYSQKTLYNPTIREKLRLNRSLKQAIAQRALSLITEGDSLFLDSGSTTLELAKAMKHQFRSLYILTNSIPVASELADSRWDVLVLGGNLRPRSLALIGPATERALEVYRADKAFLAATGVTLEHGYSTPNPLEAPTKRAMLKAAKQAYAVVDSSKLGHAALASFAALEEVEALITDDQAPARFLESLEQRGLGFLLAGAPEVQPVGPI